MNNDIKIKFCNIDLSKYNGLGYTAIVFDAKNRNYPDGTPMNHGQKTLGISKMLQKNLKVHFFDMDTLTTEAFIEKCIPIVEKGNCLGITISAHGFKMHNKDGYDYLANNTWIAAAIGNTRSEELLYPSAGDRCFGTAAGDLDTVTMKPKYLNYSTKNWKVDGCSMSNMTVDPYGEYGGSSCSTPFLFFGIVCRIKQWFSEQYGYLPDYKQVNALLENFAIDMKEEGEDIKTGMGCPVLFNLDNHWSASHRHYMKNIGMFSYSTEQKRPYNTFCSRGDLFLALAQVNGFKQVNKDKAVDYLRNECNMPIKGVNADGALALDRLLTRGELFVILARIIKSGDLGYSWQALGKKLYYKKHIEYLIENGVSVNNKTDNDKQLTFDSMCALISRMYGYKERSDRD